MNENILQQFDDTIEETRKRLAPHFRIEKINTSDSSLRDNPGKTCERVAETVLSWVEEHLQEDILFLDKNKIVSFFGDRQFIEKSAAERLSHEYLTSGKYQARRVVESDSDMVQALPIVVVRKKNGEVLRLRRKEKSEENPLHQQLVIWSGGHVRKEDAEAGNPLLMCAKRELEEELRLCINESDLTLLGAIYFDEGKSTARHLAIVYEWRSEGDDVEIALSSAEFFERRGTSLSGTFIPVDDVVNDVESKAITEQWSAQIVARILAPNAKLQADLFRR